ncbi:TraM recognition domain-containing protein [bacterium]|nr:TraM recognition domain-containing protein [bacterium]
MRYCRALLILSVVIVAAVVALVCVTVPWAWVLPALIALGMATRKGYQLTAFGTARWADAADMQRSGMLAGGNGLILGRMQVSRPDFAASLIGLFNPRIASDVACERFVFSMRKLQPAPPQLVRLSKAVHVAVFAPTGVGKGVSCVIPHLLTCRESMVVVDFKGENAKLTARHRAEQFGHKIVILDPFKVTTDSPDTFNPFDMIDSESALAIDDCRDLAEALVVRTGQEKEPHWCDSAESWIAAMAALITQYAEPADRTLQTLRTLLTNPQKMQAVIKLACESTAWDGMLARMGHQLTQFEGKELSSVLTTTNRFLRFLDTLAIAHSTKASTFDPRELPNGKMTVYLVLPPEHMRAQSALLRMWIGALLRAVVRGGLQETNKVHFVLDEAASLGHMDALDDAVDKYRGYGVRLQFYYQSVGQLKKCWPEGADQTLLSNTTQVFFGVSDLQTAEYVSSRLGESTIIVESGGTSTGGSTQVSNQGGNRTEGTSWNVSQNWQQHARKLLKPEEVAGLNPRSAITFAPGVPPIRTTLIRYFEEPSLGKGPSWWKRFRVKAEVWLAAVLLLSLVSVLGVRMAAALLAHPSHNPHVTAGP